MENPKEVIAYLTGRLEGLAGTTRYNIPEGLRNELKQIAKSLDDVYMDGYENLCLCDIGPAPAPWINLDSEYYRNES